ncbi:hypothetical protein EMPG_13396 [Blastomyces silverae]|uniref:Uncharacterized protein n=1 Tax=Blastomyces silverae TaxID=2060906 RepID=A0A0H1BQB4_9EURO|nr:hypothetical protein EMPG_13396 [Blastomyces silverae]
MIELVCIEVKIIANTHLTFNLDALLDTWYGPHDEILGIERSTQYTYEALFGTVYTGRRAPEDAFQNIEMRFRFYQVQGRLDKLQEIISGYEPLEVLCYDDFLNKDFPEEYSHGSSQPDAFWDNRAPIYGGRAIRVLPSFVRCNEDRLAGNRAFMSMMPRINREIGTIILCPQNFQAPETNALMLRAKRPFVLRRSSYYNRDEPFHLEDITYRNVVFIFLCLLGQLPILGNEPMVPFKHPPVAGRQVYGWEAATLTALTHPDKALHSPENYAFLIFALYLDKNDWSVGTATPMLPTENGITHFYYSINGAYEALVRNGNGPNDPPPMDWNVD